MSIVAPLEAIDRWASTVLAYQRKHNHIDINLLLQNVDVKFNRNHVSGEHKKGWNLKDACQNMQCANGYLHLKEGYPCIGEDAIQKIVETDSVTIEKKELWYIDVEWSEEEKKMVQTKKSKPIWKLLKTDCYGATSTLKTPKFFSLESVHAWLDIKYAYVLRVDPDEDCVWFTDWHESEFRA